MSDYTAIASVYDRLGAHIDYAAYAALIGEEAERHGIGQGALALDVGCGTGVLTTLLAEKGFDMIGVDHSDEMLGQAMQRGFACGCPILWLRQDMRHFELYGTVKLICCTVDAFNYLLTKRDVEDFLWAVRNYLEPGGLFIFDTHTRHQFEQVFGNRDYILEDGDDLCCWQNRYREKTGVCDFRLSVFRRQADGSYRRQDEIQREKLWSDRTITSLLRKYDLSVEKKLSDLQGTPASDADRRHYWICVRE